MRTKSIFKIIMVFVFSILMGVLASSSFANNNQVCDPASTSGPCPASCNSAAGLCNIAAPLPWLKACVTNGFTNCSAPGSCGGVAGVLGLGCTCAGPGGSC